MDKLLGCGLRQSTCNRICLALTRYAHSLEGGTFYTWDELRAQDKAFFLGDVNMKAADVNILMSKLNPPEGYLSVPLQQGNLQQPQTPQ